MKKLGILICLILGGWLLSAQTVKVDSSTLRYTFVYRDSITGQTVCRTVLGKDSAVIVRKILPYTKPTIVFFIDGKQVTEEEYSAMIGNPKELQKYNLAINHVGQYILCLYAETKDSWKEKNKK